MNKDVLPRIISWCRKLDLNVFLSIKGFHFFSNFFLQDNSTLYSECD